MARTKGQTRRAAVSSFVGTTLEWYDFFIFATTAALVFPVVFFPNEDGLVGTLASFATFAVGFFARPFGSILFGHFGDRIGRRNVLMVSLIVMGAATVGMGLIPGYGAIGIMAPIILTVLRIVQGIALGGEWGGAALMSVEHAPEHKKGFFGSSTQVGSPAGLLLATLAIGAAMGISGDEFVEWGWRIPFIASILVVIVGVIIRMGVQETQEFEEVKKNDGTVKLPILEVLRTDWRQILLGAGLAAANNAIYYLVATYTLAYTTAQLGVSEVETINHLTIVSVCYLVSIPFFGWLADKVGLRRQVMIAALVAAACVFPYFWMIDTGDSLIILLAMIVALAGFQSAAYAPQPAIYAGLFPPQTRYTGASLAYAIPTTVVGGTTPFIATWLFAETGSNTAMAFFIVGLCLVAALCAGLVQRQYTRQQREAKAATLITR